VERLYILAPALIPIAYMVAMFGVYCVLCATGRTPEVTGVDRRSFNELTGPFITRYFIWLISPVERLFVANRVSPNFLTFASLAACAASGLAIATNHMATAAWMYAFAGFLDILDGRLARATNQQSVRGGFLDSVSDRWGELFVFCGFAWFLRDSNWLLAVMLAVAGSMMVSYTRARGEGLGLKLDGGLMQRAERIGLVALGTMITAWFHSVPETRVYGPHIIGVSMLIVGLGSSATAVGRWVSGYNQLKARELGEKAKAKAAEPMRISGEHTRTA
jgi:phosphatidylglycerophosphate synthase